MKLFGDWGLGVGEPLLVDDGMESDDGLIGFASRGRMHVIVAFGVQGLLARASPDEGGELFFRADAAFGFGALILEKSLELRENVFYGCRICPSEVLRTPSGTPVVSIEGLIVLPVRSPRRAAQW